MRITFAVAAVLIMLAIILTLVGKVVSERVASMGVERKKSCERT
jgi:hypothetical protein